MPHMVIKGRWSPREFWESFAPLLDRDEKRIIKLIDAYMAADCRRILIECTVVEGFLRQSFLIEMAEREDGLVIRLFGPHRPEKTEGVRQALAWIGRLIITQNPGCSLASHNLGINLPAAWTAPERSHPSEG